ncbi:S9 family peptidase [Gemmata sp. JC717]|uniref:S9 family peptidase n=1 Tax=Gemmata algarum TaxID=2975278 RepID=UPI0021BB981B|nr:S9 family peptidase [Gemmata algarum]MDY3555090.1 S9 family peptidase [Gemmata algarum]
MRFRLLLTAAVLIAAPLALPAADKRPMKVQDLFAFKRVASPQISPDGKAVVYQVTTVDLGANKSSTALWLAPTDGKTEPKQITDPKGKKDMNPRWSPDGTRVLFESTRSGAPQLWVLTVGEEPKPVTSISTGASNGTWAPDGKSVAFVSTVYPEFSEKPFPESDKLNKEKDEEIEKSPVKAKTFTKLFYRHWDDYVGDKRQHLFVCNLDGTDTRDITPGDRDANPTSSTFSSGDDFTFSPDGKYLVFTAVPDKDESWSTNYDICRVSVTNTSTKWECLTKDNKAADGGPKFSPDGKKLAWRAQKQAGYEADKWDILAADANPDGTLSGPPQNLTAARDVSANEFAWGAGGAVAFVADDSGSTSLFHVTPAGKIGEGIPYRNGSGGTAARQGHISALTASRGGDVWMHLFARMASPAQLAGVRFSVTDKNSTTSALAVLIPQNLSLLAELDLAKPESVKVKIEDGEMQMWVLKPPGFDASKKWPVAYLVHGGPQGAWEDAWSFRWNPQAWAAQGYVVVMPNPRGSTGFGQKFVDEITGDWGGKCYRDLMAGLDYVEKLPYVDKDRIGSAGGSFGGYMMNWFAVNDAAKRFKCLITHCSVWNFESMWGTTDELWFDEWEHGGLPWEKPGKYAEFSPHKKAGNMAKAKTPMLIIHNDLDFRCPIGQGHELFSALQRQGVPSRFVNFPDEGHWVLKPKNSEHWHKEVFAWLKKYVPPGPK